MQLTSYDRRFYRENIAPFLTGRLWDCHAHLHKKRFDPAAQNNDAWMYRVASENTGRQLADTYAACFPDQRVNATVFGMPSPGVDIEASNRYVREVCARQGYTGLALVHPDMDRARLRQVTEGFAGIKVYLCFAPASIPAAQVRITDFLTRDMLELCDERELTVMLHIPRSGRLKDPVNLAQMLEIEERYPRLKLIIAHVGRAYCEEDLGDAFAQLRHTRRMMFDISANTCREVFEALLDAIEPSRILFGSDLPILAMRSGRVTENGVYYNVVPKGLYGDLTGVPNMRETESADTVTLLLYESMAAFLRACRAKGLAQSSIDQVFYQNAARLWGGG